MVGEPKVTVGTRGYSRRAVELELLKFETVPDA